MSLEWGWGGGGCVCIDIRSSVNKLFLPYGVVRTRVAFIVGRYIERHENKWK